MNANQNTQNVIDKYSKWLTKGQKAAIRKRAGVISTQNAKTRSEIQTQARQGLRQTNDFLSSMGLSSNLRRAPSSGVDEESRRMPEFRQQLQGLRAQEQGVLDKFGRRQANATIAARRRAAEEAARRSSGRGYYTVIDPATGEATKNLETGEIIKYYDKAQAGDIQRDLNDAYQNEATSIAWHEARTSGGLNMNGANLLPVAKNMSLGINGADTGIPGRNVTRYEIGKTGAKIADVISNTISALNKEMAAATKPVFTGAGADDARQEQMALRKMTAAKTRMNNVIDYAAEIGAISKASAETFKGRVNSGTFDYENSGAYITGRIQQTTLNNAKTNAEKLNTAVTGFVGEKTPTKAQTKFFEAYRQASITGSMDDLEAVGAAYVEVLREQNNAQIETAQGIAQEAIDLGVDPIIAGQAMDAFKAGDTQGFFDILNSGVDGVNLEAIKKTSDKYFEQGYMDAAAQAAVYQAIEAGDVEGAQKALEDGVKESLKEQEKALLTEAYEDALTNDIIYKGEDAAAWNHFDAKYRVAMMTDTPEAWEEARDAYTDVVTAAFNASVLQAKADADNAVKYGITQQEADEAVEAYKNGDTETYLEILGRCGLGGEQPGYVACLERDAELAQFGIDYATFQSYAKWSDEDIDAAIDSLTAAAANGSLPEDEETVEMMIRYNQWIADGKTPEQAQEITGLTDEEIAQYAGKTQEELTAAGSERMTAIETLEGVKKARTADRNTEKVQEYMALSLDEIGQRIDDINVQLEAGKKTGRLQGEYMNSGTLSKTERERLEQDKVLLGYAQSRLWAQERAKKYETTVTKAAAELRKSGAFDIRAEAAMQAGKAVNSQIRYENGKFYFTYDDDEARGEFAEGVSDRLKVTGRTKVTEDRWNELGWTGTGDTYFNAQVFQSADGKYVVMSTVTNSGVPMSASWAMKYQEKIAKGSDPDALRLGVFDSREEAESYAYDVDEIAERYSTGFDRNNEIDGEIGAALGVFALINDPAMLWAGYGSDSGDVGMVKYAEHKLAEQAIAEGKEGEGLAYEAIKGGWTAKGNRALEKEAMAFGANTVAEAFNWYTYANADEKKLLAYYCATDPEKAGDYYAEVNKTINERVMNDIAKAAQSVSGAEVRDEKGNVVQEANGMLYVASKAATFITKPLEAAGGIYVLWNSVTGQEVDPNNKAFIFNTWDTAVRQTQYEALQARFDAWYGKEKGGSKLGQSVVFAYQTLDSVIDSWINAQMGLAIGGKIGHGISLAAMGLNAAGETTRELIEKGVPQDQAKKLGMLAGVFEAMFEVVSLENIIHGADDLTKEWWKRAGISGVLEGSEELFTKAANIAVNSWVLDASSDYSTEIAEMMTSGRGYATAAALATWNQAVQTLTEAAGGVLSGDITGVVNAFKANFNAKGTGKAIRTAGNDGALVEAARKAGGKAGEYLRKIGIGVATNRNLSDLELGRLNYALAMTDLDTITGRVNGLVDDGTITKAEGKAVRKYLDNLYQASAHGYASTAYGIELDTSALEGVSDSAMRAVSAAAFEMTEGRADNMNAPGNTATGEYSTEAAREEQRELRRMNAEQVTAEDARTMVEQGVVQKTDFSGTVFVQHTEGKPSREQKTAVKFAAAMAKAGGTEIVVHDTLPTNGVMIDGVLHVALDSDRGFVSTVAHEMTHWLRAAANDDSYGNLVSFLKEQANGARRGGFEKLVEQKANEYRELYPTATDDEIRRIANDEAVATLCETMLSDETFVRELMQKDATLFEKIYNWIGEVLDNFRSLLASDKEVRGTKEAERWVQDIETARDLWYACMTEAKANAEAGAMETEGVVFSKKEDDFLYSSRYLRDELYDLWGDRQRPSHSTYEQYYEEHLNDLNGKAGTREYKPYIDNIVKEYGSIEEYARHQAEGDVRENEEIIREWKPFEARANELMEEGLDEREAAQRAYNEVIEGAKTAQPVRTEGPSQVPVYDLRRSAEQKLTEAEDAEAEAVRKYGEGSAEAEAAAQEADAAYVELQRIREEERLDRENEERLATEGTPEEIAEATSFDYGLNADETVRTENDRKQTQTEEDADTLRALDEKADREAFERRMKERAIPLPEEGREIRDERTAEEYEADILENEHRNAAEANRAATEARLADEVRQNRIDEELRETEAEMQRRRNENDWTEADKREQDRRIEKLRRETERLREKYENETDEQKKVKREWEWHNAEDKLAQAMRTRERMNRKGRVAPKNSFDGTPVLDEAMASIEETERVKTDENGKKTTTKVPEIIEKIVNGAHRVGSWTLKTSERMIDAVAKGSKEVKEALDNLIQRPLNEAAQRYTQNLLRRRGEFNKKMKDLGIWETGSKEAIERTRAKSAAIQKYGEGFYYNEQGERLTYTIDDLKKDFPDDWQKIVEAEQYCRDLYDDYHDMYNEMLERIYPNVIEHLIEDEKQLQGLVDKEKLRRDNQIELAGAIKARIASIQAQLDAKKPGTQAYTDLQNSLVYQQGLLENAQHLAMIYEGKAKTRQQQLEAIVAGRKTGDLVRNRRLARRTDYYHHFTESADGFARLAQIWNEEESDIDPLLAGKTSQTNPRKGYAGFAQRRIGEHTQYDAIKGMHLYMNEMERRLAYDPVANHYKNLIDQLRRTGHNGVNGDGRMEKDVDSLIRWLEEERNQIVGKTNSLDRQISDIGIAPRKIIKALKWLNSRVKANRVVGNVHSAAVQASNLTNAMTYVTNLTDWASAIMDFVKLNFSKGSAGDTVKQIMSQSGFLTQRYGLDALEYDETKGLEYAAGKMMGYMDEKAGQLMWLAAYNQFKAMEEARANGKRDRGLADTGHTYRNAIEYADDITRRSTAGRGIGELAPLMTSSVVGMISPFQIEVNNTFQNLGEQIKKKNFKGLAAFALATTLMNTMSEVIFGDRPLPFDLIDAIVSALKGDFDDDDEDEEEQTTGKRVLGAMSLMGKNTVQTVMNGVPMASLIQGMVGGLFDDWLGDSSYTSGGTMGASAIGDSISGAADFAKHVIKGDVDTIDKAWTLALQDSDWMNVLLPWGGAQLQRTLKGVDAAVRGYSQKMNKDGELEAQFAIDSNPLSFLRSATFGKWSTKEGKAYLSGETRGLTAEKTEKMKEAKAEGMDPAEFFRKMSELKQMSATKDEYGDTVVTKGSAQLGAIAESEASEGAKKAMLDALGKTNAMRDRWEADTSGIGIDAFLRYASDYGDKTDLGEDETAKNAFLMKVAGDGSLTNEQKIAMTKIVLGKDGKKAAEKMQSAMDAGVDVQKYLGYYLRDGKQEEKLDALMADESLTAEQKGSIAKLMYPDAKERDWSSAAMYTLSGRGENEVSKANVAIAKGVSPEKVNEWYDIKSEKRTDPATGAIGTVDQSEVLDRLAADKSQTPAQKAAIQTMLFPDSKPRDYSNEGWYYLSATSSGTEGKAYKYAKIAVEQGIPLAACVAETKEYNRRNRTKTGHGSSGGCTTKDTKEICRQVAKDYGLNTRQASILQKIYLGKWK